MSQSILLNEDSEVVQEGQSESVLGKLQPLNLGRLKEFYPEAWESLASGLGQPGGEGADK